MTSIPKMFLLLKFLLLYCFSYIKPGTVIIMATLVSRELKQSHTIFSADSMSI